MCRHVGYVGQPITLDDLLLRPKKSLLEQTWAPSDMREGGTVNVDGFGIGWYTAEDAEPSRYRRAVPMWTDANLPMIAGNTRTTAVLAAVRSATVGMPVTEAACAPFADRRWLFSHNGKVDGWPHSMVALADTVDTVDLLRMEAPTDSALLWTVLRRRLADGVDPVAAVTELVHEVVAVAPESRMNLLLTDGTRLIATTWTHSLAVRRDERGVTVSSEPFDTGLSDSDWNEVADRHLVVADPDSVSVVPLARAGAS